MPVGSRELPAALARSNLLGGQAHRYAQGQSGRWNPTVARPGPRPRGWQCQWQQLPSRRREGSKWGSARPLRVCVGGVRQALRAQAVRKAGTRCDGRA